MKKLTITGLLILILGTLLYPVFVDEISGISQAIVIGLMSGSGFVLRCQFEKK